MNERGLYRLMAWLSPSYPVGAFSYSHGIEWLVEIGDIKNADSLVAWVTHILTHGSGRNDAILFAEAYRAAAAKDMSALTEISELAAAFAASAERHLETCSQGCAFAETTRTAWTSSALTHLLADDESTVAYPVAVAVAAADHDIDLPPALAAYLHAFAANLVSAGVCLIPLGHTSGQIVMARLESVVTETAGIALSTGLDDLGSAAFMMDMASMKHETQYTRLFRS